MIKHILTEWPGIAGPKKSWWYKMQLFNPEHHAGNLLYLDLDTVVVRDLSWVTNHDTSYFWGIRDFRYLQNPHHSVFNSSFMWWNVSNFSRIWDQFSQGDIAQLTKNNQGDQDYITKSISVNQRRFFDDKLFQSFRWQCLDGGYNFQRRQPRAPGTGVAIAPDTAVVVFHGIPKPHQISDPAIAQLWC
jgi:lipopolysaccharide biosynthesis glycosyltransferase